MLHNSRMKKTALTILLSFVLIFTLSTFVNALTLSECNQTKEIGAYYTLDKDLYCNEGEYGITISGSNTEFFTLDCQGHSIIGTNNTEVGIYLNHAEEIIIQNCTVINFQRGLSSKNAQDSQLKNNQFCFNSLNDLYLWSNSNLEGDSNAFEDIHLGSGSTAEFTNDQSCPEITCFDKEDNDGDGFIDCEDSDCANLQCGYYEGSVCVDGTCTESYCNDGIDNDLMIELIESNESNEGEFNFDPGNSDKRDASSYQGEPVSLDAEISEEPTTELPADTVMVTDVSLDEEQIGAAVTEVELQSSAELDGFKQLLDDGQNINDAINYFMLDNMAADKSNAGELWNAVGRDLQERGFTDLQIGQVMLTNGVSDAGAAATLYGLGADATDVGTMMDTLSNSEYQGRRAQAWAAQGQSQTEIAEVLILQGATEEETVQAMVQAGMEETVVQEVVQETAMDIAQVLEMDKTQQFGFAGFAISTGETDGGWILKSFNWIRSLFGGNVAGQAASSGNAHYDANEYLVYIGWNEGSEYNFSESDGADCSDSDCSYQECGENSVCYEGMCTPIEYEAPTVTVEVEEVTYFTTYENVLTYLNSGRVYKSSSYSEIGDTYNGICEDFCDGKGIDCGFADGGRNTCLEEGSTTCTCY
ncbi:right-handed parallel beta-helix repeat-containing protein [archaeon]|jgi:hypothetical protein|nr:right-handed parallel beta-helix repeat-containing protein [archaeon]MBT7193219.1 right-handed parallel beta-helix repeat-containing protein [archaeon]MBT7380440.1 right-handed parallel beta-helix repeat-containing protein [archaeon]MBT7507543.1 right-handed parallel beta-helix repeat-containing protein [archaeon]